MKRMFYTLLVALLFALPAAAEYQLVWEDDFDGESLNT